jgi:hypothetical protein
MTNRLSPLRLILALATVFTAAGCDLYFGGQDAHGGGGDRWTYCGSDGYYVCQGDNCEWANARCPDDPNYTCASSADCAAGCFCAASGVCEEAGFCGSNQDCPTGYTCDTARSSCVPDAPPPTCTTTADCVNGTYCQDNACVPGTCAGPAATCNLQPPTCAEGQVPLIDGTGCYAGTCFEIAQCSAAPSCQALQHENDCLNDAGCTSVYTGLNCTKPDGSACHTGDTGCTCASFQYDSCTTHTTSRTVIETPSGFVDGASYLSH